MTSDRRGWRLFAGVTTAAVMVVLATATAPTAAGQSAPADAPPAPARPLPPCYPKAAGLRGVEGYSVVECRVRADRRLVDCKVTAEYPAGAGFGEAGLCLARVSRARLGGARNVEVGQTFGMPVRWTLAKGAEQSPPTR